MPDITHLHSNVCPCCHAKNKLIKYGTYERNLSILEDSEVVTYKVTVQRATVSSVYKLAEEIKLSFQIIYAYITIHAKISK